MASYSVHYLDPPVRTAAIVKMYVFVEGAPSQCRAYHLERLGDNSLMGSMSVMCIYGCSGFLFYVTTWNLEFEPEAKGLLISSANQNCLTATT